MCMYGNISMTEFIKAGYRLTGDFPLTWVDYLIICCGVLLAMLGFGLNSSIIFVLGNSVPSSYDLVQINLAVADAVIHIFYATFALGEFLDTPSHIYKRSCPSVRPSVRPSVGPSRVIFERRIWPILRIRSHQMML